MAENLVDGEFWLPAQFLTDEDVFDAKDATLKGNNGDEASLFPSEFPYGHHNQYSGLFSPRRKSSFFTAVLSNNNNNTTNPDVGFHTHQSLSQQQLQIAQMLRQNQIANQQNSVWGMQNHRGGVCQQRQNNQMVPNRGRNGVVSDGGRNIRPLGLSQSAWPPLQHARQQQHNQQYGSGMRTLFLGNPSGRRERAGTGVFLPCRVKIS